MWKKDTRRSCFIQVQVTISNYFKHLIQYDDGHFALWVRGNSTQETCHLLLQLPMFKASRDFIILSLDGSRAAEDKLEERQRATALSIVEHYMGCPDSALFNSMTLQEFA